MVLHLRPATRAFDHHLPLAKRSPCGIEFRVVLRAGSFEEAEAIAKEDPLHKAGLRTFTLQKWRVNEGRITVTVDFSDQTMKIE